MARINKTRVVEDPSDNELNDGEDVESTGAGAGGGESMPPPSSRSSVCSASRDVCNAAGLLDDSVWSPQQR